MSEHRDIPQATELVYLPRPSWGPALFAGGLALAISGLFIGEYALPGWVYSIVGLVFLLVALRGMVAGAARDFFRLPRRQRVRGAVLPAVSMRATRRD